MTAARNTEVRTLNHEIITCVKCRLSAGRIHAVPGEGPVPSRVLLIGEAPGRKEDELGRPFVGRAGSILESLLASIGLSRDDAYITSIVKCRPPENRDPKEDEISACRPYLEHQISLLRPAVIVSMGRISSREIFRKYGISEGKIGSVHGKVFSAKAPYGRIFIIPIYHPAVITHNPNLRPALQHDFEQVKEVLSGIIGS
jgi:uracil-DNA glycosylase family 4